MKKATCAILILVVLLFFLPVAALLLASFLDGNLLKDGMKGACFSLLQYRSVFQNAPLLKAFKNSLLIAFSVLLIQIPLSAVFGFALSNFRGKAAFFIKLTLALSLLLPFESIMVPLFKLSKWTNLYDKQIALILFQAFSPLPFLFVSLLISSVDGDLIKAASLDTDSSVLIFTKIILPPILPGLCVTALLCFSEAWNLTEPALILLPDSRLQPASIAINDITERSMNAPFAASILYSAPVIFLYLLTMRLFNRDDHAFGSF